MARDVKRWRYIEVSHRANSGRFAARVGGFSVMLMACLMPSATMPAATDEARGLIAACAQKYAALRDFECGGELITRLPDGVTLHVDVTSAVVSARFIPADYPVAAIGEGHSFGKVTMTSTAGNQAVDVRMPSGWGYYDRMGIAVRSATIVGADVVPTASGEVPCQVVEVQYDESRQRPQKGTVRYSIDPKTSLVMRQVFSEKSAADQPLREWTYTVRSWKFDSAPPAWMLSYAREMATERVEWTGRSAPDVSLEDLGGDPTTLASLRGKTVVLDFWATWCGPCHEQMRVVEKIRASASDKFVVLGITDEDAATAKEWLSRHHHTLRTLTDTKRSTFESYGIEQIPVLVIISPTGKVVRYLVGVHKEDTLRSAIEGASQ